MCINIIVRLLTNNSLHLNIARTFVTGRPLLAKKAKADVILVACKSVVSGHFRPMRRARLGDKIEFLAFDPWVQKEVIYKEVEKIKSVREDPDEWYGKPSELKVPNFEQSSKSPTSKSF